MLNLRTVQIVIVFVTVYNIVIQVMNVRNENIHGCVKISTVAHVSVDNLEMIRAHLSNPHFKVMIVVVDGLEEGLGSK